MHTCMYIHTYVCMHACYVYVCMYVCMYVCRYVCMLYVYTYVMHVMCMYVCMYVCMYIRMYVCMHVVCMCIIMYVCMYAYACTRLSGSINFSLSLSLWQVTLLSTHILTFDNLCQVAFVANVYLTCIYCVPKKGRTYLGF